MNMMDCNRPRFAFELQMSKLIDMSTDGEKIGVEKIKVKHVQENFTAVLADFVGADKLLLNWASSASEMIECEFEVIFLDGYRIEGTYEVQNAKTSRSSLRDFIRNFLQPTTGNLNIAKRRPCTGKILDGEGNFVAPSALDRYEICEH